MDSIFSNLYCCEFECPITVAGTEHMLTFHSAEAAYHSMKAKRLDDAYLLTARMNGFAARTTGKALIMATEFGARRISKWVDYRLTAMRIVLSYKWCVLAFALFLVKCNGVIYEDISSRDNPFAGAQGFLRHFYDNLRSCLRERLRLGLTIDQPWLNTVRDRI